MPSARPCVGHDVGLESSSAFGGAVVDLRAGEHVPGPPARAGLTTVLLCAFELDTGSGRGQGGPFTSPQPGPTGCSGHAPCTRSEGKLRDPRGDQGGLRLRRPPSWTTSVCSAGKGRRRVRGLSPGLVARARAEGAEGPADRPGAHFSADDGSESVFRLSPREAFHDKDGPFHPVQTLESLSTWPPRCFCVGLSLH